MRLPIRKQIERQSTCFTYNWMRQLWDTGGWGQRLGINVQQTACVAEPYCNNAASFNEMSTIPPWDTERLRSTYTRNVADSWGKKCSIKTLGMGRKCLAGDTFFSVSLCIIWYANISWPEISWDVGLPHTMQVLWSKDGKERGGGTTCSRSPPCPVNNVSRWAPTKCRDSRISRISSSVKIQNTTVKKKKEKSCMNTCAG